MAKTLAGASGYAPDSSMDSETERPHVGDWGTRDRERVGGQYLPCVGVAMERPSKELDSP